MAGSVEPRLRVTRQQILASQRLRAHRHSLVQRSPWEHPSLAQLWGPRYSTYVVPKCDFALFSLGRLPDDAKSRLRAERIAEGLHA